MISIFAQGYVYVNSNFNDVAAWFEKTRIQSVEPFCKKNLETKLPNFFHLSFCFVLNYFSDKLLSADIDDGPSQKEIDFRNQMKDEALLDEFRLIHEKSKEINEHGIGIF